MRVVVGRRAYVRSERAHTLVVVDIYHKKTYIVGQVTLKVGRKLYCAMHMISTIFGSATAADCLLYLHHYGDGHARGIARTFDTSVSQVQKQLKKFEITGVLKSRMVGNSRLYEWNHDMQLIVFLREFLQQILESLPEDVAEKRFREIRH